MSYNAGMGTNQPPSTGPREYVVEVERKRPVLIVIIAVLMLLSSLMSGFGVLGMMLGGKFMDMAEANSAQMTSEQRAQFEEGKEAMEKVKEHSNVLVPMTVVEGIAFLGLGIGLILRKEWARIGSIVLLAAAAAYMLVEMLALHWTTEPGQISPIIFVAIYALSAYYLTNVAWAFQPKSTGAATGARA